MQGYFRFPTLFDGRVVFVAEDSLWEVELGEGGECSLPRRLTAGRGELRHPRFSPDGKHLAYVSDEEGGDELYLMPSRGGSALRITYEGQVLLPLEWSADGAWLRYVSAAGMPFEAMTQVREIAAEGGISRPLPCGLARFATFSPTGDVAIARHMDDGAFWKGYRGGRLGEIFVDRGGRGQFHRLEHPEGNAYRPLWVGERLYFVGDWEGNGELYSCDKEGTDLQRHTAHGLDYIRHPSSDGRSLVYSCAGELWHFDPNLGVSYKLQFEWTGNRSQCARRLVEVQDHLEAVSLNPRGDHLASLARGQVVEMGLWEGAARNLRVTDKGRVRAFEYLNEGDWLALVDDGLKQHLVLAGGEDEDRVFELEQEGRIVAMSGSPDGKWAALSSHRHELWLLDLKSGASRRIAHSPQGPIDDLDWAPDSLWLTYALGESLHSSRIELYSLGQKRSFAVTDGVYSDWCPRFEAEGKGLSFLSDRAFEPMEDSLSFAMGFQRSTRACWVQLWESPSPFRLRPRPLESEDGEEKEKKKAPAIDADGCAHRVLLFPLRGDRYQSLQCADGRAYFLTYPEMAASEDEEPVAGFLSSFDFETQEIQQVMEGVVSFAVYEESKSILVRSLEGVRVLALGHEDKDDEGESAPGRKSGWLDMSRARLVIDPAREWRQIFNEAWRLMQDHYWEPELGGVDWDAVYARYEPLLAHLASRGELSDLLWLMQGEMRTSHSYEWGGDYQAVVDHSLGSLGASFSYSSHEEGYRIEDLEAAELWDPQGRSPLLEPGVSLAPGDFIYSVDGLEAQPHLPLEALLLGKAGVEVELEVRRRGQEEREWVTVDALFHGATLSYRAWVQRCRARVHSQSGGKVGYVHVPDMGPRGYAEFYRGWLSELTKPGLVLDLRFNEGGNISPLLLEKLARRRLGFDLSRWGAATPYPPEAVMGPVVVLINENSGSDAELFAHAFRRMGLGTLVGKRTWGGVIGIWPRHAFADGGYTSQPEFAFCFDDLGLALENKGVEPDIAIEELVEDQITARDPQLEAAIDLVLEQAKTSGCAPVPKRFF